MTEQGFSQDFSSSANLIRQGSAQAVVATNTILNFLRDRNSNNDTIQNFRSKRLSVGILNNPNSYDPRDFPDTPESSRRIERIVRQFIDKYNMSIRSQINRLFYESEGDRILATSLSFGEQRDRFVNTGQIPAYYSTSNIVQLLNSDMMPVGWNIQICQYEGFGQVVRDRILARNRRISSERQANMLSLLDASQRVDTLNREYLVQNSVDNETSQSNSLLRALR